MDESKHYPAVIVQGSLTSVKEQMPATYADKFAAQGFVVLAFDYAHYGESAGEPRQLESPAEKRKDLQSAVSYLTGLPYVQAVGMVGVCTSGSNAVDLAGVEPRLGALATVAGFLPSPAIFAAINGGEDNAAARIAKAGESRRAYEQTGEAELITAYSETDPGAWAYVPMPGAFDYYTNPERAALPEYRNEIALMSATEFAEFDPVSTASSITTPTIVVHADDATFPEQARALYEGLAGEKELVWGPDGANHYDFYDTQATIDFAVENVSRFFRAHLAA